jgi:PAS domain S-box-containing protein
MEPQGNPATRLTRGRLAILAVVTLVPWVTSIVTRALRQSGHFSEVEIASAILLALVFLRMSLLLRQVERSGAAERELAAIVETSNDAIAGATADGAIKSWNAAAEAIYGYSAEEVLGRPFSMLIPPEAGADLPLILESLRGGERIDNYETVRMKKDGSRVHVSLAVSPIRDKDGSVTGASAIARDITRQREWEEERRRLQVSRGRLLARTIRAGEQERRRLAAEIHDGPVQHLAALDVTLETLRRHVDPNPRPDGVVERVQEGLQKTIRELRRLMVELHPPALKERGLRAALADHMEQLERASGIEPSLECELPARLPSDIETTLYRIAQEALANVTRHARATAVSVRVDAGDGCVQMDVRDDGVGFDPDRLQRNPSGEHFGLIGMRQRAEMVGGSWEVSSAPGAGTTVCVRLPMEVAR